MLFKGAQGLFVAANGSLIVAYTAKRQVLYFDRNATLLWTAQYTSSSKHRLVFPCRVSFCELFSKYHAPFANVSQRNYTSAEIVTHNAERVVVVERAPAHQLQLYDVTGRWIRSFGQQHLQRPSAVTVDEHGQIVVAESKVMRIAVFSSDGDLVNQFVMQNMQFPIAIAAVGGGNVCVADNRAHRLIVFNYAGRSLRSHNCIAGAFPVAIAAAANGNITVASNHNELQVCVYDSDGKLQRSTPVSKKLTNVIHMAVTSTGVVAALFADGVVQLLGAREQHPIDVEN